MRCGLWSQYLAANVTLTRQMMVFAAARLGQVTVARTFIRSLVVPAIIIFLSCSFIRLIVVWPSPAFVLPFLHRLPWARTPRSLC